MAPPPHPPQPGLIPACAGKTGVGGEDGGRDGAHPRVCGENGDMGSPQAGGLGSSPRVRGKRDSAQRRGGPRGLIPACAGKTRPHRWRPRSTGAHPRVCGENAIRAETVNGLRGSSPRVRGKPAAVAWGAVWPGLIPACAGKTGRFSACAAITTAHPRVCGENGDGDCAVGGAPGSSPRVRGKPRGRRGPGGVGGLIPACAGKTSPPWSPARPRRAHPRVCGENVVAAVAALVAAGSSPRVRGKPHRQRQPAHAAGLIPACAGKTPRPPGSTPARSAHPRVCGENVTLSDAEEGCCGSSPRVRGKLVVHDAHATLIRLIPACAGKTRPRTAWCGVFQAHPRVCGENQGSTSSSAPGKGSSPRVRGKPLAYPQLLHDTRLIPACAGKTSRRCGGSWVPGAHPRVCGENGWLSRDWLYPLGSSPRVRGKQETAEVLGPRRRLIPACAGKTSTSPTPSRSRSAHPRVCGENRYIPGGDTGVQGSSPRVRGKPRAWFTTRNTEGLIPACAGKTTRLSSTTPAAWAHPRVCGENRGCGSPYDPGAGSSPRVRGKRSRGGSDSIENRLIPACAGKTLIAPINRFPSSGSSPRVRGKPGPSVRVFTVMVAHPRVCGENWTFTTRSSSGSGSSPRVRGKRLRFVGRDLRLGLIPACAGKTRGRRTRSRCRSAHPRVCGENQAEPGEADPVLGSSPRVRGKLADPEDEAHARGLIPACAGKTYSSSSGRTPRWAHPRVCGENTS